MEDQYSEAYRTLFWAIERQFPQLVCGESSILPVEGTNAVEIRFVLESSETATVDLGLPDSDGITRKQINQSWAPGKTYSQKNPCHDYERLAR